VQVEVKKKRAVPPAGHGPATHAPAAPTVAKPADTHAPATPKALPQATAPAAAPLTRLNRIRISVSPLQFCWLRRLRRDDSAERLGRASPDVVGKFGIHRPARIIG